MYSQIERVDLARHENNITSQCGENGVLTKIFEVIGSSNKHCVEFGAFHLERGSNVCPLWRDEGWTALLIEGSPARYRRLVREARKYDAGHRLSIIRQYVQPSGQSSLDSILRAAGWPAVFDLLSIDVDGMEYHIWEGLHDFRPRVLVVEYNPTIPSHVSLVGSAKGNYIGSSARALAELGRSKAYTLVACTALNAIFVSDEYASGFDNAGQLERMIDTKTCLYAIQSYDGGIAILTSSLPYGFNPLSSEPLKCSASNAHVLAPAPGWRRLLGAMILARAKRVRRRLLPFITW